MITPDITRLSPNFNDAPVRGRTVIIHSTRSGKSQNPSEFDGTLNYMSRIGTVSSHWVIARDGRIARVVPDNLQAWHAAEDNDNAWGIELEQGVEADGFTNAQIDSLVDVCRGYVEDFAVPAVHATSSTSPGFIGHQETTQGRASGKSDPGRLFPWDRFLSLLNPAPPPPLRQGWSKEGPYQVLYNDGVPVLRIGGALPGRISKLFGDKYLWLRVGPGNRAIWDEEEGD